MTAGEIRPGVHRPDWTVVTRPQAREALVARGRAREGLTEKWKQALEPSQDRVWRAIIELFARSGRPPLLDEIGETTGLAAEDLLALVSELEAHDRLGLDRDTGAIAYAYPFTGQTTEHRVRLRDRTLHAVCAIDALGVASMLGTDTTIESSCRGCTRGIEIRTADRGKSLGHVHPGDAVGWYDLAYGGRAATSCCPSIAFFCSAAELAQWLNPQNPPRAGCGLTLDEALEVGRALFEPVLSTAPVP